ADPSELTVLPAGQWGALGERGRRDDADARTAHHAELVVVSTSAIPEIPGQGQVLLLVKHLELAAWRGMIVTGAQATGQRPRSTPAGKDLSDHLKDVPAHLPATFIYAGIEVER